MKRIILMVALCSAFAANLLGQAPLKLTTHSGSSFQFGNFERGGRELANTVRLSVVINMGFDFAYTGKKAGISFGLESRNLGVILDDTLNNQQMRTKHRVYTIGAPVTLMFGNIEKKVYAFVGGEYEYTFDYKEKVFLNGDNNKDYKSKGDYTYNVNRWLPSVFGGIQLPMGSYVKFQYYLTDFFDSKYQFKYTKGTTVTYPAFTKSQMYFVEIGTRYFLDDETAKPTPSSPQSRKAIREKMYSLNY